ncbi:uncharacterized protein LOC112892386 [Panicum hallii]|uniref:uncharacterized protein LOC112892386 n=1 Tax=Panicum hallii TaxID=206008 RepID=UPI000DF4CBDB|nr:uncharacterized protein LOC112892386 [Panicum hallii]
MRSPAASRGDPATATGHDTVRSPRRPPGRAAPQKNHVRCQCSRVGWTTRGLPAASVSGSARSAPGAAGTWPAGAHVNPAISSADTRPRRRRVARSGRFSFPHPGAPPPPACSPRPPCPACRFGWMPCRAGGLGPGDLPLHARGRRRPLARRIGLSLSSGCPMKKLDRRVVSQRAGGLGGEEKSRAVCWGEFTIRLGDCRDPTQARCTEQHLVLVRPSAAAAAAPDWTTCKISLELSLSASASSVCRGSRLDGSGPALWNERNERGQERWREKARRPGRQMDGCRGISASLRMNMRATTCASLVHTSERPCAVRVLWTSESAVSLEKNLLDRSPTPEPRRVRGTPSNTMTHTTSTW